MQKFQETMLTKQVYEHMTKKTRKKREQYPHTIPHHFRIIYRAISHHYRATQLISKKMHLKFGRKILRYFSHKRWTLFSSSTVNSIRRRGSHLADAIDKVAEEEARGADQELLPPGPVCQRHTKQSPPLLLPSGHGSSSSLSPPRTPTLQHRYLSLKILPKKPQINGRTQERKIWMTKQSTSGRKE